MGQKLVWNSQHGKVNPMKRAVWTLVVLAVGLLPAQTRADIRVTATAAESTEPAVAVAPDQTAKVVWAESTGGTYQIWWASVDLSGAVVNGPVQLTSGATNCRLPRVAVDSQSRSFVVWVAGSGSSARIHWLRVGPTGSIDAGPVMLFTNNGDYKRPDIDVTPDGTSHVVFEWGGPGLFHVKYMVVASGGSVVRSLVAGDYDILGVDKYPSVALEPGGIIDIAWNDVYNFTYGLYLARYGADGTRLSRGRIKNGSNISWPTIVAPRNGSQWILYQQPSGGVDRIWKFLGADTGQIVSPAPGPSRRARAAGADGQPTYAVWEDWSTGTSRIMAGKWDPAGVLADNSLLLSGGTAAATLPSIGTDANGLYAVAWTDRRDGNGEIYLEWIPANGAIITVRDRRFAVPVPNVRVVLYSGSDAVAQKQTGADGTCRFGDLPPGQYWTNAFIQQFEADEAPPFQIPEEGYTSSSLVISTTFEGRCRIADAFNGGGIRGAFVELFRRGIGAVDTLWSEGDGLAAFSVPDTGTYFLRAIDKRIAGMGADSLTYYAPARSGVVAVTPADVGVTIDVPDLELETRVVVLVHGWTGNPRMWTSGDDQDNPSWAMLLRNRGWTPITDIALPGVFGDAHGLAALDDQARYLEGRVEELRIRSFHVVAHSMGGLVTRQMTERLQAGELPRVVNLITLATPHHGTPAVNIVEALILLLGAAFGGEGGLLGAADLIARLEEHSPAIRDLKPNSSALRSLNQGSWFSVDWLGNCLLDNPNPEHGIAPLTRYLTVRGDAQSGWLRAPGLMLGAAACAENDGVVPTESAQMWSTSPQVHNYDARAIGEAVHHKSIPSIHESLVIRDWVLSRLGDDIGSSPPEATAPAKWATNDVLPLHTMATIQIPAVPGESRQDSMVVDGCDTLRVNWTWFAGRVNLELVAPGGAVIDSAAAAVDPDIEMIFDADGRWGCYLIPQPAVGTWQLVTSDVTSTGGEQQAYVWLQGRETAQLGFELEETGLSPASPRIVRCPFVGADGSPIVGAALTATVTGPSGTSATLALVDDGEAPDDLPGDGVYCTAVNPEATPGVTVVEVEAVAGGTVETRRTVTRSFNVANGVDLLIQPPGLMAVSTTGQAGAPVELSALVRGEGIAPVTAEVTFWLSEPFTTLAVDTVTVPPGVDLEVTTSHLPLRARLCDYRVRVRPLGDMQETTWANNTSSRTLQIGMAATGVPGDGGSGPGQSELDRELAGRPAAIVGIWPNPFNPVVKTRYAVSGAGPVRLGIYDVRGRLIRRLVDGWVDQGIHEMAWDGKVESGAPAASGVYLLRFEGAGTVDHRKLTLVR